MEKTVIKYVTGLPENASRWQVRMQKKYGKLSNIVKYIDYDIKHGVSVDDVKTIFSKIRNDSQYGDLRNDKESMVRLDELERQISL
ncbi:MAG: hypothetical protein M3162_07420, partial [Thermoproteota archaeon]|nr:hypothetical protein [Thermoproteota archaeon]